MPTGKKSSKARPAKSAKVPAKSAAKPKPSKPAKPTAKKSAAKKPVEKKPAASSAGAARTRERKFAELFGPSFPKGKGLNVEGEPMTPAEVAELGFTLLQFPPPEGRMSWIYATHGLSTLKAKGADKPTRIELVIHWREKHTHPLRLLNEVARQVLETGIVPEPGQILSAQDGFSINVDMARHCITVEALPGKRVEIPGASFTPLVLIGISDAELEYASRVRAELADGRQVLTEALRLGGIVPVTDSRRQCLTRRRDFNKIWETAFRTVRERKGSAS